MFTLTHSSSGFRSQRRQVRDAGGFITPKSFKDSDGFRGRKPKDKK
jgi:hypothetical protein